MTTGDVLTVLSLAVGIGTPFTVGLVLLLRGAGKRVAWILLAGALSIVVVFGAHVIGTPWSLVVGSEWTVLFLWPLALAYVYPDGRLPSRRWRPMAIVAAVSGAGTLLLLPLQPTLEGPDGDVENPIQIGPGLEDLLAPVFWACWFGLLAALIGGALALALDDPSAEVVFRLPETGAYADRRGHLLDALPGDGRARSVIGRDDRELGILLHGPGRDPGVLRAVLEAAAVPVELARLRVELRLQLAEVESSRARIAHAGYEERRRIERDLHDGAQQRLVTLGIVLRRLQRSLPREARMLDAPLDAAVAEVAGAIADLRTIAAGVRPPRLDEGLAAALDDLARGAGVPVEVLADAQRSPPELEAAAYFVACEALTNAVKHASPTRVVMETARENGVLTLLIADDGVGGAAPAAGTGLPGMLDRVAAQGGTLAIDSPPGAGTRIAVELPCAS